MKAALVILTAQALKPALRIIESWPEEEKPELWLPERLLTQSMNSLPVSSRRLCKTKYFKHFRDIMPEVWIKNSLLIFIMATGIVVRHIAPFLRNKDRDPAVVVLDEKGEFVISLLSGHLGGANSWARVIAQILEAKPVITTATDVEGLIAPDEYARRFNWGVDPVAGLRQVNRFLLEEGYLQVWTDYLPEDHPLREDKCYRFLKDEDKEKAHIWITPYATPAPKEQKPLLLIPRIYAIGVGCRKGVGKEQICEAIHQSLQQLGLSLKSIIGIFSIDIKARENGIIEAAQTLGLNFKTFSAQQIQEMNEERKLLPSKYVKEKIGVDGVCEAASLLGTRKGELVLPKQIYKGITVAISKEKSML